MQGKKHEGRTPGAYKAQKGGCTDTWSGGRDKEKVKHRGVRDRGMVSPPAPDPAPLPPKLAEEALEDERSRRMLATSDLAGHTQGKRKKGGKQGRHVRRTNRRVLASTQVLAKGEHESHIHTRVLPSAASQQTQLVVRVATEKHGDAVIWVALTIQRLLTHLALQGTTANLRMHVRVCGERE